MRHAVDVPLSFDAVDDLGWDGFALLDRKIRRASLLGPEIMYEVRHIAQYRGVFRVHVEVWRYP